MKAAWETVQRRLRAYPPCGGTARLCAGTGSGILNKRNLVIPIWGSMSVLMEIKAIS